MESLVYVNPRAITWQFLQHGAGIVLRYFARVPQSSGALGTPSWQGYSVAQWEYAGGRRGGSAAGGHLKVVTTNMRPGYLRKNGVRYSANVTLAEYYSCTRETNDDSWLIVTTIVELSTYFDCTLNLFTCTYFSTGTLRFSSSNQFWTTTISRGGASSLSPSLIMRNRRPSGDTS